MDAVVNLIPQLDELWTCLLLGGYCLYCLIRIARPRRRDPLL